MVVGSLVAVLHQLEADIKATASELDQEHALDVLLCRVAALVPLPVTDGNPAEDTRGSAADADAAVAAIAPASTAAGWVRQGGAVTALLDVLATARQHCSTQNPAGLLAGCAAAGHGLQGAGLFGALALLVPHAPPPANGEDAGSSANHAAARLWVCSKTIERLAPLPGLTPLSNDDMAGLANLITAVAELAEMVHASGPQEYGALITTLELLHALLLWAVPSGDGAVGLQTRHLKAVSGAAGPRVLALAALVLSGGPKATTPTAKDAAERLLQRLAALSQATSRSQLAARHMVGALTHLQIDEWEGLSGTRQAIFWVIASIKYPDFHGILNAAASPLLQLLDHHTDQSRVTGLHGLRHLVEHVLAAELKNFGMIHVIVEALSTLLYVREAVVIDALLQLYHIILPLVEYNPVRDASTLHDRVVGKVLKDMAYESSLERRHAYARHLPALAALLGIGMVKHFTALFKTVTSYLEETHDPESKVYILELLRLVITTCWVRIQIPGRRDELTALLVQQRDALIARGDDGDEVTARTLALLCECLAMVDQLEPVAASASA